MARNYHLTGLEPASVWENFYAISQIPRETGNPEGITSYLLDFCKAHGIEAYRCLLYTSPSPRDRQKSRMPSSA